MIIINIIIKLFFCFNSKQLQDYKYEKCVKMNANKLYFIYNICRIIKNNNKKKLLDNCKKKN